jgi:glutamate 5-kinase
LHFFVNEVNELIKNNNQIIIVSSGAIGLGRKILNYKKEKLSIKEQQGLASIGQYHLMNEFEKRLTLFDIKCAQLLVSQMDLNHEETLNNIKNTLDFLFENNVLAIINENDSVSTIELRKNGHFSDNDFLSALISKKISADLLILLTNTCGLIGKDNCILENFNNEEELLEMKTKSSDGTGGINSKLRSIKFANENGVDVFVSGKNNFFGFYKGNAKGTFCSKK